MTSNEGMKELIFLINKLQDAASTAGMSLGRLDLPQIAVVGGQSAGKSSVLENFVGRDFLPRGSGIVTRRPLVLQLYNCPEEYAEFLHLPSKKFTNFLDVRKEIEAETDRETGQNKGISNRPINLRVYSPHVLELTLVDLPGITKVPVGDQPPDIEKQIRNMILEYIVQENTLILAVSPANQDLANSDALKLALSVDPDGMRTIGVVTKLDLMDKGTDAKDILENKVFSLRRGYVGLVNRSQADIDGGKDIHIAQSAELEYFTMHESYRHMAERMGTKYLQKVLNQQLCEHIRDRMPLLKANIKKQHQEVKEELEEMKAFDEGTDSWRQKMIIKLMQDFAEELKTTVEGRSIKIERGQLSTGARINSCIYQQVFRLLDQVVPPSEKEVKLVIRSLPGFRNSLFVPDLAFDVVVQELLVRYSEPLKKSAELIATILNGAIMELTKKFVDYPRLKDVVQSLLTERLKTYEDKTKRHLQTHIEAQASFMNNKHPDFVRVTDPSQIPSGYKKGMTRISGELTHGDSDESLNSTTQLEEEPASANPTLGAKGPAIGSSGTLARSASTLSVAPPPKPVPVYKGWVCILPSGITRKTKDCWFVLMTDAVSYYRDENEREQLGFFFVDGLKMTSKGKHGKFVLSVNGRPVSKDHKTMTLTFRNGRDEEAWCQAFQKVGVEVTKKSADDSVLEAMERAASRNANGNAPMSDELSKRRLYQAVETDPEIQDGSDMLVYMVMSYMKIVDKTIHDITPKYIIHLLVNEIVEYSCKFLLADVMDGESWKELLEVSPEEVAKRERLFAIYESTKKAIELMNAVNLGA